MSSSLRNHQWRTGLIPAALGLALAGCAARVPPGPTVMALPAQGESFSLFQQHDATCRQYASEHTDGRTPGQAGISRGIAGAAVGTGMGSAAGALIGSASGNAGAGAAIGAGSGLLAGTLLGAVRGRNAAAATQSRYNIAYSQCMVANGERVPQPIAPAPVVYAAPPPGVVYVPPPVYTVSTTS
jgi:hypothetical protein